MRHSLYGDLVDWYGLLDARENHAEEVAVYDGLLAEAVEGPYRTLLELGAGAGNNGYYFRRTRRCTLTDLSEAMLDLSRGQNPECEHVVGDMRTMRLGREFDAVFVHDAVVYMLDEEDLRRAAQTALVHTRPGGAALFAPDIIRDNFREFHEDDAADGEDGRGMRYIAWVTDPDPEDSTYQVDYAFLLRDGDGVRSVHETHTEGLFSRATWIRILSGVRFEVETRARPLDEGESELPYCPEVFLCRRPR